MLKLEPNVCLLEPDANVDAIYARTRILLAPSLWAEAFGLVVVKAALRGIHASHQTLVGYQRPIH